MSTDDPGGRSSSRLSRLTATPKTTPTQSPSKRPSFGTPGSEGKRSAVGDDDWGSGWEALEEEHARVMGTVLKKKKKTAAKVKDEAAKKTAKTPTTAKGKRKAMEDGKEDEESEGEGPSTSVTRKRGKKKAETTEGSVAKKAAPQLPRKTDAPPIAEPNSPPKTVIAQEEEDVDHDNDELTSPSRGVQPESPKSKGPTPKNSPSKSPAAKKSKEETKVTSDEEPTATPSTEQSISPPARGRAAKKTAAVKPKGNKGRSKKPPPADAPAGFSSGDELEEVDDDDLAPEPSKSKAPPPLPVRTKRIVPSKKTAVEEVEMVAEQPADFSPPPQPSTAPPARRGITFTSPKPKSKPRTDMEVMASALEPISTVPDDDFDDDSDEDDEDFEDEINSNHYFKDTDRGASLLRSVQQRTERMHLSDPMDEVGDNEDIQRMLREEFDRILMPPPKTTVVPRKGRPFQSKNSALNARRQEWEERWGPYGGGGNENARPKKPVENKTAADPKGVRVFNTDIIKDYMRSILETVTETADEGVANAAIDSMKSLLDRTMLTRDNHFVIAFNTYFVGNIGSMALPGPTEKKLPEPAKQRRLRALTRFAVNYVATAPGDPFSIQFFKKVFLDHVIRFASVPSDAECRQRAMYLIKEVMINDKTMLGEANRAKEIHHVESEEKKRNDRNRREKEARRKARKGRRGTAEPSPAKEIPAKKTHKKIKPFKRVKHVLPIETRMMIYRLLSARSRDPDATVRLVSLETLARLQNEYKSLIMEFYGWLREQREIKKEKAAKVIRMKAAKKGKKNQVEMKKKKMKRKKRTTSEEDSEMTKEERREKFFLENRKKVMKMTVRMGIRSPKNILALHLRDKSIPIRLLCVKWLRAVTVPQAHHLMDIALFESDVVLRREAIAAVGRIRIGVFMNNQRLLLLSLLQQPKWKGIIENRVLRPWLYDLIGSDAEETKKSAASLQPRNNVRIKDLSLWVATPTRLVHYIEGGYDTNRILDILERATKIARAEACMHDCTATQWVRILRLVTDSEPSVLKQEDLSEARPSVHLFAAYNFYNTLSFIDEIKEHDGDYEIARSEISPTINEVVDLCYIAASPLVMIVNQKKAAASRIRRVVQDENIVKKYMKEDAAALARLKREEQTREAHLCLIVFLQTFEHIDLSYSRGILAWELLLHRIAKGEVCEMDMNMWFLITSQLFKYHRDKNLPENEQLQNVAEKLFASMHLRIREEPQGLVKRKVARSTHPDFVSSEHLLGAMHSLIRTGHFKHLHDKGIMEKYFFPILNAVIKHLRKTVVNPDKSEISMQLIQCIAYMNEFTQEIMRDNLNILLKVMTEKECTAEVKGQTLACLIDYQVRHKGEDAMGVFLKMHGYKEDYLLRHMASLADGIEIPKEKEVKWRRPTTEKKTEEKKAVKAPEPPKMDKKRQAQKKAKEKKQRMLAFMEEGGTEEEAQLDHAAFAFARYFAETEEPEAFLTRPLAILLLRLFSSDSVNILPVRKRFCTFITIYANTGRKKQDKLYEVFQEIMKMVHDRRDAARDLFDSNGATNTVTFLVCAVSPCFLPMKEWREMRSKRIKTVHMRIVIDIMKIISDDLSRERSSNLEVVIKSMRSIDPQGMSERELDHIYTAAFETCLRLEEAFVKERSKYKPFLYFLRNLECARADLNRLKEEAEAKMLAADGVVTASELLKIRVPPMQTRQINTKKGGYVELRGKKISIRGLNHDKKKKGPHSQERLERMGERLEPRPIPTESPKTRTIKTKEKRAKETEKKVTQKDAASKKKKLNRKEETHQEKKD